jgi:hypothetical protein
MTIKLHTCTISKRGKGAKGTVVVETFGIPIVPKKGNKKITKKWDYAKLADKLTVRQVLDACESVGKVNGKLLVEAILRGRDAVIKSQSIRNGSERIAIVRMILESGLARSKKEANNLASVWQQTQSFLRRSHSANIPTIEELAEQRRLFVVEQKEKNLWEMRPEDDVELLEDYSDDESDDDSDDSDED